MQKRFCACGQKILVGYRLENGCWQTIVVSGRLKGGKKHQPYCPSCGMPLSIHTVR